LLYFDVGPFYVSVPFYEIQSYNFGVKVGQKVEKNLWHC